MIIADGWSIAKPYRSFFLEEGFSHSYWHVSNGQVALHTAMTNAEYLRTINRFRAQYG